MTHDIKFSHVMAALLRIQSFLWTRFQGWFNLQNPAGILLSRRASLNFPNVQSNRKVINRFTKKGHWKPQTTYLPSHRVCSASALNTIGLYNRNGARYSISK